MRFEEELCESGDQVILGRPPTQSGLDQMIGEGRVVQCPEHQRRPTTFSRHLQVQWDFLNVGPETQLNTENV